MSIETVLLVAALLLLLSVAATRASGRFNIPALLLFLGIGMLAGSDGPGGIAFSNAALAQAVGVVALLFILFAGGLETDWSLVRPVLAPGLVLATIGVFISALLMAVFAQWALGFTFTEGLLLGSIVSSTDAAAVFSILRTQGVHLRGKLEPLIEFESGSNDPMAVFLTTGVIGLLMVPGSTLLALAPSFLLQMGLGAAGGYVLGRAMVWVLNHARLQQPALYSVMSIGLALLAFAGLALLGGNGFLGIYIAGVVLGNALVIHKRSITSFHDGVAWLMQIIMFLTLGLLVFPSQLPAVAGKGLAFAFVLAFVARPLSVALCLVWFRVPWREMVVVTWAGLRGAVPIVLATFPLLAGVPRSFEMFNIVFFVVLVSVLVQGSTLRWVARRMGVQSERPPAYSPGHEFAPEVQLNSQLVPLDVGPDSPLAGAQIFELRLPRNVLVVQVQRDEESIVPDGSTVLRAGDRVLLLATPEALAVVENLRVGNKVTA